MMTPPVGPLSPDTAGCGKGQRPVEKTTGRVIAQPGIAGYQERAGRQGKGQGGGVGAELGTRDNPDRNPGALQLPDRRHCQTGYQ